MSPSKENFLSLIYITALEVTSAPDPAEVGIATSLVNFLFECVLFLMIDLKLNSISLIFAIFA